MSQMIKKIMIAVDFSDFTGPSVEYGIALARELKAKLLLVNVVNIRDIAVAERCFALQEPQLYQQYVDDAYSTRKTSLEGLLAQAAAMDVSGTSLVLTGVPYQELLSAIDSEKPDLLVMGTKGRSNLGDTFIGSCAQKMYRRSPIPLLSIRPPKK